MIRELIVAVTVLTSDGTRVAHREPRAPRLWSALELRGLERAPAAAGLARAGQGNPGAYRRIAAAQDHRAQREPGTECRVHEQLRRRERGEAGRVRDPLKRQVRAAVLAVCVERRAQQRLPLALDVSLGVAIDGIGRRGERRVVAPRDAQERPETARVADQDANPALGIVEQRERELSSDGARVESVPDVEASLLHRGRQFYHRRVPADLHRELLGDPSAPCLLFTHGIYGSGANWRAIARKLIEQRADWSVALVDLRNHGRSGSGEQPHTLAACAGDLAALVAAQPTIRALAGHSFGGKVVLATRSVAPAQIAQTWMFDSSPSARADADRDPDNSVVRVLGVMERLPRQWASRDEFIAAVIAAGEAKPLAQWLGMNVIPNDGGGYGLRLDLGAVREMLADYYAQDLWPVALDPALPGTVEVVVAEKSTTLDGADRDRLASAPPHVHTHRIDAGHWLHIEAPANVVELLVSRLPTRLR